MRKLLLLIFVSGITTSLIGGTNPNQRKYNFFSFSKREKTICHELDSLTPSSYKSHPDYGILPFNKPCENCIEMEDHRDASSRYFVEEGTGGNRFYKTQSYGAINYLDAEGNWREINYRLQQKSEKVFQSTDQPNPVTINLERNYASIINNDKELRFNENLELNYIDREGKTHSLGKPDWSHYSAGDDGILVKNIYNGIDLQMIVLEGKLKTNFIINSRFLFSDGWLVMKQSFELPGGFAFDLTKTGKNEYDQLLGEILISNQQTEYFRIHSSVAYDAGVVPQIIRLGNKVSGNELLTYIPVQWLNAANTIYPVVIDPLVSSSSTLPQASITGSQYSATCWTSGCTYSLNVMSPANCTITGIYYDFDYIALGSCNMSNGGISFDYGSCRAPDTGVFTCGLAAPGLCIANNISILNSTFQTCLQPPQCNPYSMNFTMHFYRCSQDPTPGCNSSCIAAASAWSMTIKGETFKIASLTPNILLCEGANADLVVNGTGGVPPYSFLWNPSGSTNDTINVAPVTTTVYHILVTDACGITATDSTTVNVIQDNNPGFTVIPNPACAGQNLTFTGLGSGAASNYDWQLPGSNNPAVNNTQSTTTLYALQGSYVATLNYQNGTCIFPHQQNITIDSVVTPSVNVSSSLPGPVCAGTTIVFTATPVNGGTSPTYQWKVNGINAGTNSDTFTISLNSSSTVSVILTSSYPCLSSATVSGQVILSVTLSTTPSVNISSNFSQPFCSGSAVLFTATPNSGGSSPSFQWQVDGVNAGTNSDTFSISTLANGSIVGVIMNSNFNCASPLIVTDTVHTIVLNSLIADVNITTVPDDTVCTGTNVQFNAIPVNGGNAPTYQWSRNGVPITGAVSGIYSSSTIANGDNISVMMTSDLACANPAIAADTVAMHTIPNVVPVVSISVNPDDTVCTGTNVVFTAAPANGGANPSYQWKVNGLNAGTNSPAFSSTTFINGDAIKVSMTSDAVCAMPATTVSSTVALNINPWVIPSINISATPPDTICLGSSVVFLTTSLNSGTTPSYQWNVNGILTGTDNPVFTSTTLVQGDSVKVQMTSNERCATVSTVNSNTVNINSYPPLIVFASGSIEVCQKVPVVMQAVATGGNGGPYDYTWNNGAGNTSSVTIIPLADITYTVSATDECTIPPVTATVSITVKQAPVSLYSYGPNNPTSLNPEVSFTDLSTDAINWLWIFGDGDSSIIQNPVHIFPSTGTYSVSLIVQNILGCTDTVTFKIIVNEDIAFFVPNSFSPNGDGRNETFSPIGSSITDFEMIIYDRWGNEIFSGGPLTPWNGTIKGGKEFALPGIYIYRIDLKDSKFEKQIVTGGVTLIR